MTADEIALAFRGLLGPDVDRITAVAALSTVPSVLREMRTMLGRYWSHVPQVVDLIEGRNDHHRKLASWIEPALVMMRT